jgi:hypothetical protein
MDEHDLRAMIRESIARQTGGGAVRGSSFARAEMTGAHASHALLPMARDNDEDGACFIEPSVRCNHCNYCVSLGH